MSELWQTENAGIAEMPAVRSTVNDVKTKVLSIVLFFGLLIFCDAMRSPKNQFSACAYVGIVHTYQSVVRPLLDGVVACRFRPTCSEYSIGAVQKYGIGRGLILTVIRLASCTNDVPMGTGDEVP